MSKLRSIQAVFKTPFFGRIIKGTHHSFLRELNDYVPIKQLEGKPLRELFDFLYSILLEEYRCEYVYKNMLVNQLYLQGAHIPENSTLINELDVCSSKADVAIINGKSAVYEIKSKYDSLDRLESQIADYKKVFDRIYVVTCAEKIRAVEKKVGKDIGIYELEKSRLNKIREAESNKVNIDPKWVFCCMHRAEYLKVIEEKFGYVPPCDIWLFMECKKLFCQLDPEEAHDAMVEVVRSRARRKLNRSYEDLINVAPESLKYTCVSFFRTPILTKRVVKALKEPFRI